jgi:hypothetical protein
MTEDEGSSTPELAGVARGTSTASATGFSVSASHTEGFQTASLEIRKFELKERVDLRRLDDTLKQKEHERRKDWWLFCLVVAAMAGGMLLGVGLLLVSQDPEARRFGQSLILFILGALGGYVTGSKISS